MDISFIIVSYNTEKILDDCLSSIYSTLSSSEISFEIIVIDNVSTDKTREMLRNKYPRVITILNSENVGFGRANNQGIRKAKGEYICLINSDTVSLPGSLQKLYEFSKKHPKDFVGPKLLNIDESAQTSCGYFFTLPVVFASLFLKGDVNGLIRWSPDETKKVDWVSGACFIGKRSVFMQDLLFDEKIFMYMEEVDLFMRARAAGHDTYFFHESTIFHLGGGSSTNKRTGPVLNIYKGLLYVYKKHYSALSMAILKLLLRAKAVVSVIIGYCVGSTYLKQTYVEAYKLV